MNALGDVIVEALQNLLRILFTPITAFIEQYGNALIGLIVGTPHPDSVFAAPTNGAWPNIYEYYWGAIMPLSLTLYGMTIGLVIFLESTSHLFGSYHRSKLKKRAFTGLLGILSWWWIAAISLRLISGLTGYLVPDLSEISLFQTISFGLLGVLGVVFALSVDFILFVLIALIYTVRQLAIYLFVLLMPLLIVFWIPGVGPFTLVSRFMTRLAGFYLPIVFMTVPIALLFRLGELLGDSIDLSLAGFGAWLLALLIPVAAILSPLVLFWQAGALFFMADRASHRVSGTRARQRTARIQDSTQTTAHSGRNFGRGLRGTPAVSRNNQQLLDSRQSRAHSAGSRVRTNSTRLRDRVRRRRGRKHGGRQETKQREGTEPRTKSGEESTDHTNRTTRTDERNANFDTLRKRGGRTEGGQRDKQDREETDTRPWYID